MSNLTAEMMNTKLGTKADVFAGVSRHGRTVILDENEVRDRANRGLQIHSARLLAVSAIDGERIDLGRCSEVHVADSDDLKRYVLQEGDLILPCRSTKIWIIVVPAEAAGVAIDSTLMSIRPHGELDPFLLAAYLQHPMGQAAILQASASGTTQMNITVKALRALSIPVPKREEQKSLRELVQAATRARDTAIQAAKKRFDIAMEVATNAMATGDTRND